MWMKVFRITGKIRKPNLQTSFRKEIAAMKPEHAVEKVYAELGSKHRVKRFHIKIDNVEEIQLEDIEDLFLKKLVIGEEINVK